MQNNPRNPANFTKFACPEIRRAEHPLIQALKATGTGERYLVPCRVYLGEHPDACPLRGKRSGQAHGLVDVL